MKTITFLKAIKQMIYQFSEKTPPEVKRSQRNYLVAKIAADIDDLINHMRNNKKK